MSLLDRLRRKTGAEIAIPEPQPSYVPSEYLPPEQARYEGPVGTTFGFPVYVQPGQVVHATAVYRAGPELMTDEQARATASRLRAEYERLHPQPSREELATAVADLTRRLIRAEESALPRYGDSPVPTLPAEPHTYWDLCDLSDDDPLEPDAFDEETAEQVAEIREWVATIEDEADRFAEWVRALPDRYVPLATRGD